MVLQASEVNNSLVVNPDGTTYDIMKGIKKRKLIPEDEKHEYRLAYLRKYRSINKDAHRSTRLKNLYGVTLEEYKLMYEKQEGKCAVCGVHKPIGGKKGLVIDHCHNTKKIRELLCGKCNSLLGRMEANIEALPKFFEYMKKHDTVNNGITWF